MDFTNILAALAELATELAVLKGKIDNDLVPAMQQLTTDLATLDTDIVQQITAGSTALDTGIDTDMPALLTRLASIEAKLTGLQTDMGSVETTYSDTFLQTANNISTLYDIQEEIKTYLVQAKNIINT